MAINGQGVSDRIRSLVAERDPQLSSLVDSWLVAYKDPELLYASLVREYCDATVDSSDDESFVSSSGALRSVPESASAASQTVSVPGEVVGDANGSPASGPIQGVQDRTSEARAVGSRDRVQSRRLRIKPYKQRMCLAQPCRLGADCTFAHTEEELRFWRTEANDSKREVWCPPGEALQDSSGAGALATSASSSSLPSAPSRSTTPMPWSFLELLPSDIGFCHDTVCPRFRSGQPILQTVLSLASGETRLRDIETMEVVLFEGAFFSLSNRRLTVYRLCEHVGLIGPETPVKVRLLENLPRSFMKKFTTSCDGSWVRVRYDGRICGKTLDETTFGIRELFH